MFGLVQNALKDSHIVRLIGDRFQQYEDLEENSPLLRSRDIAIPVMLLHGRRDGTAAYAHSEDLYTRLRFNSQDVEFVALPQTGHNLNDYEDRVTFYARQRAFIQQCLN